MTDIQHEPALRPLIARFIIDSLGRRWDPLKHPRDRKGRFIETFAEVRAFFRSFDTTPRFSGRVRAMDRDGTAVVEILGGKGFNGEEPGSLVRVPMKNLEEMDLRARLHKPGEDPHHDAEPRSLNEDERRELESIAARNPEIKPHIDAALASDSSEEQQRHIGDAMRAAEDNDKPDLRDDLWNIADPLDGVADNEQRLQSAERDIKARLEAQIPEGGEAPEAPPGNRLLEDMKAGWDRLDATLRPRMNVRQKRAANNIGEALEEAMSAKPGKARKDALDRAIKREQIQNDLPAPMKRLMDQLDQANRQDLLDRRKKGGKPVARMPEGPGTPVLEDKPERPPEAPPAPEPPPAPEAPPEPPPAPEPPAPTPTPTPAPKPKKPTKPKAQKPPSPAQRRAEGTKKAREHLQARRDQAADSPARQAALDKILQNPTTEGSDNGHAYIVKGEGRNVWSAMNARTGQKLRPIGIGPRHLTTRKKARELAAKADELMERYPELQEKIDKDFFDFKDENGISVNDHLYAAATGQPVEDVVAQREEGRNEDAKRQADIYFQGPADRLSPRAINDDRVLLQLQKNFAEELGRLDKNDFSEREWAEDWADREAALDRLNDELEIRGLEPLTPDIKPENIDELSNSDLQRRVAALGRNKERNPEKFELYSEKLRERLRDKADKLDDKMLFWIKEGADTDVQRNGADEGHRIAAEVYQAEWEKRRAGKEAALEAFKDEIDLVRREIEDPNFSLAQRAQIERALEQISPDNARVTLDRIKNFMPLDDNEEDRLEKFRDLQVFNPGGDLAARRLDALLKKAFDPRADHKTKRDALAELEKQAADPDGQIAKARARGLDDQWQRLQDLIDAPSEAMSIGALDDWRERASGLLERFPVDNSLANDIRDYIQSVDDEKERRLQEQAKATVDKGVKDDSPGGRSDTGKEWRDDATGRPVKDLTDEEVSKARTSAETHERKSKENPLEHDADAPERSEAGKDRLSREEERRSNGEEPPPEANNPATEGPSPEEDEPENDESSVRYPDIEDAANAEERLPEEEFEPTKQQKRIYAAFKTGKNIIVRALAGTGKTSTIEGIARRMMKDQPDRKGLYIAFNKGIQTEAAARMPDNVESRTANSLAWAAVGSKFTRKNKKGFGITKPAEQAKALDLRRLKTADGDELDARQSMSAIREIVGAFLISDDDEISGKHLRGTRFSLDEKDKNYAIEKAQQLWKEYTDPDSQIPLDQDALVKMWALSRPDFSQGSSGVKTPLGEGGVVFFDEAQDVNPVLARVLRDNRLQIVTVGDSNQAIYGFRGAVDQLDKMEADYDLPLTQSWRFGPQVAEWGNKFLRMLGSNDRVIGGGPESEILEPNTMGDPDAILARTNAGVIDAALRTMNEGKTVGISQKVHSNLQSMIETVSWLQGRGRKPSPAFIHEDLAEYDNWQDLGKDVAEEKATPGARMIFNLINDFDIEGLQRVFEDAKVRKPDANIAPEIKANQLGEHGSKATRGLLANDVYYHLEGGKVVLTGNTAKNKELIKKLAVDEFGARAKFDWDSKEWSIQVGGADEETLVGRLNKLRMELHGGEADVEVATAHTAKGLEWDRVRIANDFRTPEIDPETGEIILPSPEELRLNYVAVTRAKKALDPGSLDWAMNAPQGREGEDRDLPEVPDVDAEAPGEAEGERTTEERDEREIEENEIPDEEAAEPGPEVEEPERKKPLDIDGAFLIEGLDPEALGEALNEIDPAGWFDRINNDLVDPDEAVANLGATLDIWDAYLRPDSGFSTEQKELIQAFVDRIDNALKEAGYDPAEVRGRGRDWMDELEQERLEDKVRQQEDFEREIEEPEAPEPEAPEPERFEEKPRNVGEMLFNVQDPDAVNAEENGVDRLREALDRFDEDGDKDAFADALADIIDDQQRAAFVRGLEDFADPVARDLKNFNEELRMELEALGFSPDDIEDRVRAANNRKQDQEENDLTGPKVEEALDQQVKKQEERNAENEQSQSESENYKPEPPAEPPPPPPPGGPPGPPSPSPTPGGPPVGPDLDLGTAPRRGAEDRAKRGLGKVNLAERAEEDKNGVDVRAGDVVAVPKGPNRPAFDGVVVRVKDDKNHRLVVREFDDKYIDDIDPKTGLKWNKPWKDWDVVAKNTERIDFDHERGRAALKRWGPDGARQFAGRRAGRNAPNRGRVKQIFERIQNAVPKADRALLDRNNRLIRMGDLVRDSKGQIWEVVNPHHPWDNKGRPRVKVRPVGGGDGKLNDKVARNLEWVERPRRDFHPDFEGTGGQLAPTPDEAGDIAEGLELSPDLVRAIRGGDRIPIAQALAGDEKAKDFLTDVALDVANFRRKMLRANEDGRDPDEIRAEYPDLNERQNQAALLMAAAQGVFRPREGNAPQPFQPGPRPAERPAPGVFEQIEYPREAMRDIVDIRANQNLPRRLRELLDNVNAGQLNFDEPADRQTMIDALDRVLGWARQENNPEAEGLAKHAIEMINKHEEREEKRKNPPRRAPEPAPAPAVDLDRLPPVVPEPPVRRRPLAEYTDKLKDLFFLHSPDEKDNRFWREKIFQPLADLDFGGNYADIIDNIVKGFQDKWGTGDAPQVDYRQVQSELQQALGWADPAGREKIIDVVEKAFIQGPEPGAAPTPKSFGQEIRDKDISSGIDVWKGRDRGFDDDDEDADDFVAAARAKFDKALDRVGKAGEGDPAGAHKQLDRAERALASPDADDIEDDAARQKAEDWLAARRQEISDFRSAFFDENGNRKPVRITQPPGRQGPQEQRFIEAIAKDLESVPGFLPQRRDNPQNLGRKVDLTKIKVGTQVGDRTVTKVKMIYEGAINDGVGIYTFDDGSQIVIKNADKMSDYKGMWSAKTEEIVAEIYRELGSPAPGVQNIPDTVGVVMTAITPGFLDAPNVEMAYKVGMDKYAPPDRVNNNPWDLDDPLDAVRFVMTNAANGGKDRHGGNYMAVTLPNGNRVVAPIDNSWAGPFKHTGEPGAGKVSPGLTATEHHARPAATAAFKNMTLGERRAFVEEWRRKYLEEIIPKLRASGDERREEFADWLEARVSAPSYVEGILRALHS